MEGEENGKYFLDKTQISLEYLRELIPRSAFCDYIHYSLSVLYCLCCYRTIFRTIPSQVEGTQRKVALLASDCSVACWFVVSAASSTKLKLLKISI